MKKDDQPPFPPIAEGDIRLGIQTAAHYAALALNAHDPDTHQAHVHKAVGVYKLLLTYGVAKAAVHLGVLTHALGQRALNNGGLTQDEQLSYAAAYFAKSAGYFEQAIDLCHVPGDLSGAEARDHLAALHERALVEGASIERAFALRVDAAEAGLAQAQINLAQMYRNGEGTAPSPDMARKWMAEALKNKDQLVPAVAMELQALLVGPLVPAARKSGQSHVKRGL